MAQGRVAVLGDAFITQVLSHIESKKQELKNTEPEVRKKVTELKTIVDEEFKQSNLMDEARTDFDRILKERRSASEKLSSTIRATARLEREAMISSFEGIKLSYEALLSLKTAEDKAQDRFQSSADAQRAALSQLAKDINGLIAYPTVFTLFKEYYETLRTNTQLLYRLYSAIGQSKAAIDLAYQTCQSEYKVFSDKIEQLKKADDEHKVVPSGASQSESFRYSDSRNISRESIATTRSSVSSKDESKEGQHSRSSSSDSSDSRNSSIIVPPQSGRPGMRPLPPIPGTPVGSSASSSNLSTTFGASARKARDAKDNSSSQNQKKERKCTIL